MKPTLKTKQQLIEELDAMRRRMAEVEEFAAQRKLAEEALRESEQHYSALVGSLTDAIFRLRGKTITWCNDRVKDLYGYTREELIGKDPSFFFPHDITSSGFMKRISTAVNEKGFFRDIAKVKRKDGDIVDVEYLISLIPGVELVELVSVAHDITERNRAEESLASSERKYRQLVENMREGIWIIDKDAHTSFVNPRMAAMLGYSVDEMQGRPLFSFMHERGVEIAKRLLESRSQGIAEQHDFEFMRKDGMRLYVIIEASPISDETGNYVGALACATDITKRRQAEDALKTSVAALAASEKRYSTIFESAAEGILIADIATRQLKYANPAICRMLGYSEEELKGMSVGGIHPKDSLKHVIYEFETQAKGDKILAGGIPCLKKDGTILYADIKSARALIDGTKCNVGFFTDVTDRMLAEEVRKENTKKLQKAMDTTLKVLAMTVEVRDPYTAGHQQRVSSLATCIAKEMGLPAIQIEGIRIAGSVHDIGKTYVPSEILSKPGRLSEIEFSMIKVHPQAGYDILKIIEFSGPVAQTVLQHHERMDGSGYPGHLLGKDIILEARILAVADVVEAIASHRPYRPALGIDKALEEVSKNKGKLFAPDVVDACVRVFAEKGFKFE